MGISFQSPSLLPLCHACVLELLMWNEGEMVRNTTLRRTTWPMKSSEAGKVIRVNTSDLRVLFPLRFCLMMTCRHQEGCIATPRPYSPPSGTMKCARHRGWTEQGKHSKIAEEKSETRMSAQLSKLCGVVCDSQASEPPRDLQIL